MWCRHPLARPLGVRASTVPTPLPARLLASSPPALRLHPGDHLRASWWSRARCVIVTPIARRAVFPAAAAAANIDVSCLIEDDGGGKLSDRMPRHFARFSERNLPVVIGSAASEWPTGRPVRATPSSVGRASLRTVVGRSAGGYNKNTSQPTPHPTTELDSLSRTFAVARSLARLFANSVAGGAETGGCLASLSLPHAPSE